MSECILEVKDAKKSFNDKVIHKGVSFSLSRGETLGLLGGSGTGKSVLLRSLIGLEFIDQGEIIYNNQRIDNLSENDLCKIRTQIAYSFQGGALFDSLNVYENLAFPLREHTNLSEDNIKERIYETLKIIDLQGIENLMPSDLSGGMKKRVGMARAIIIHPEIVLYDEPTAGLDPTNTLNVVSIMKKLKKMGQSAIFVTHDIAAALGLCDRLIVLNNGVIEFESTPSEFKNSDSPLVKKFLLTEGLEYDY